MANSQEIAQINEINKGLTALNDTLTKTSTSYLTLVKTISDSNQTVKNSAISYENLEKAQKQTAENSKQLDSIGKSLIQSEEKLKQVEDKRLETIIRNRAETQKATKDIQLKIKAQQAERGSIDQLIAVNSILEKRLKAVNLATDEGRKKADLLRSAIDKNNATIKTNSSALSAQKINIGNYAGAFSNLSPAIGSAVSSVTTFGKALWALVANPVGAFIAAIVASLALLYKAFTSTDDGAKNVEAVLKSIGNVMDVLIDRAMSYYKMLWSLVTFDWEGVKKNAKDAFGGIGDAVLDAAKAGATYVDTMDDIEDREAASVVTAAKLKLEIDRLTVASKNRNLGTKEQMKLAQEAFDKTMQLNELEKGFLVEKNAAELKNLSSKINNDKLSIESKAAMLDQWLKIDHTMLNSELKNNEEFAKFYNENTDDFKTLQKAKASEIEMEINLIGERKRLQTALFGFQKELRDEDNEKAKDIREKQEKAVKESEKVKAESVIEGLKKQEDAMEDGLKDQGYIYQEQIDMALESDQKEFDNWYDLEKKKKEEGIKLAEEAAKKKKEIEEQLNEAKWDLAAESVDALFTLNGYRLEKEMADLEKEKELKLSNKNLSEAQKVKIEEDFTKKSNAIKLKQAKNEKLQSLFSIAISTAQASMKTLAQVPLPAGAALLAATIALGAIQAGLVMAQPLPKFAKGTDNAPSRGLFGEAGRELMFLRSGEVMMADKATYFSGSKFKGAQIISNPETESMIKMAGASGMSGRGMNDNRIVSELRGVKNAIKSMPSPIFDKNYKQIGVKSSRHQEIYLNRLTRN